MARFMRTPNSRELQKNSFSARSESGLYHEAIIKEPAARGREFGQHVMRFRNFRPIIDNFPSHRFRVGCDKHSYWLCEEKTQEVDKDVSMW